LRLIGILRAVWSCLGLSGTIWVPLSFLTCYSSRKPNVTPGHSAYFRRFPAAARADRWPGAATVPGRRPGFRLDRGRR